MRLVTHNMLKCNVKGVDNGYPLRIEVEKMETVPSDYEPELILNLLRKIHFGALKGAIKDLAMDTFDDVEEVTEVLKADETFLRKIHHALFEVHVLDAFLVCPQSGRKFPVKDGIPNMLLHEDEV